MTARTNKRPGYCAICGYTVPTGQGHIWQDQDSDEWMVAHNDATICTRNREESASVEQAREERKSAMTAESEKLTADVASSTGLKRQDDWSWDDFAYSLGAVLAESEHFRAQEYLQSGTRIGFVVKEKK